MKLGKLTFLRLKSYFRNPTLILSFAMFLVALWPVLNFTKTHQNEVFVVPIAIMDLDQSEYSKLIIEGVSKKESIYIKVLSQEEALKQVSIGKLEAVYILKEGLMNHILDGNLQEIIEIVKSPLSLSADLIGELFSAEVIRLSSNVDAANSVAQSYGAVEDKKTLWKEAWELTDAYWEPSPLVTIDYRSANNNLGNTEEIQVASHIKNKISKFLIIALLIFSILMSSTSLLKEKNKGILKRVISTGTPLLLYLLSHILSVIIIHAIGFFLIYNFITFI